MKKNKNKKHAKKSAPYSRGSVPRIVAQHQNMGQEVIYVTEDKVRLCLMSELPKFGNNSWLAHGGICATLFTTLATADFRSMWGVPPIIFESLFYVLLFIELVVTAVLLVRRLRKKSQASLIEEIIICLKNRKSERKPKYWWGG
jgi:hypothetical protein